MASNTPAGSAFAHFGWNPSSWFVNKRDADKNRAAEAARRRQQDAAPLPSPVVRGTPTTVEGTARYISQRALTAAAQLPSRPSHAPPLFGGTAAAGGTHSIFRPNMGLGGWRVPILQASRASRLPFFHQRAMTAASLLSVPASRSSSISSAETRTVPTLANLAPQPRATSGARPLPAVDVTASVLNTDESSAEPIGASEGMGNNASSARGAIAPSGDRPHAGPIVCQPAAAEQRGVSSNVHPSMLTSPTPTPALQAQQTVQLVARPQDPPASLAPSATLLGTPSPSEDDAGGSVQPTTLMSPTLTPALQAQQTVQLVARPQDPPASLAPSAAPLGTASPSEDDAGGSVQPTTLMSPTPTPTLQAMQPMARPQDQSASSTLSATAPGAAACILSNPRSCAGVASVPLEPRAYRGQQRQERVDEPLPLPSCIDACLSNLLVPTTAQPHGEITRLAPSTSALGAEETTIGIEVSVSEEYEATAGSPAPLPQSDMIDGHEQATGNILERPMDFVSGTRVVVVEVFEDEELEAPAGSPAPLLHTETIGGGNVEAGHEMLGCPSAATAPTCPSARASTTDVDVPNAEHEATAGSPVPLPQVEIINGGRQEAGYGLFDDEEKLQEERLGGLTVEEVEEEAPAALRLGEALRLRRGNRRPSSPSGSSSSDSEDETGDITSAQEAWATNLAARFVRDDSALQALEKWRLTRQLFQELEESVKARTRTTLAPADAAATLTSHDVMQQARDGEEGQASPLQAPPTPAAEKVPQGCAGWPYSPDWSYVSSSVAFLQQQSMVLSVGTAEPLQPAFAPSATQAPQQTTQAAAPAPVTAAAQVPQVTFAPKPAPVPVKLCRQEMRRAKRKADKEAAKNHRANPAQTPPQTGQQDLNSAAEEPPQPQQVERAPQATAAVVVGATSEPDPLAHVDEAIRHLYCPLSSVLMVDPIIAEDGVTYQRSAFKRYIAQSFSRSSVPMSSHQYPYMSPRHKGLLLQSLIIIPDHKIRALVKEHLDRVRYMCYDGPPAGAAQQKRRGRRRR